MHLLLSEDGLQNGTKETSQRRGAFFVYKDMAKEFAKGFYNSKHWQATRRAYINERIAIDGGLCETCHEMPGVIVHHIKNLNEDNIGQPDITLSHGNLRLDCKACHDREEGHFIKKRQTRCSFDENGQPIPPPILEE